MEKGQKATLGWGTFIAMEKGRKATLGCGTLILIVLIVLIFGNMGGRDAADQVKRLQGDVKQLQQAVAHQTELIESLDQTLRGVIGYKTQGARSTPATMPAGTE